ncbi:MAG: 4-hydroxy-tetrahydrodipicolinate reductase [Bacteroidales bacterium]|nr:4-hydroxy-tetrahydrodipicolinate reductase [Bacteroidales bacterium]MBO6248709.1 4-hydroxy-tetrahydrodipicolinate reductase [Bacteroidales bacterium]
MKVVISGYGRMGHMVEAALEAKGIERAGASEDIAAFDKALAAECVCIDFTTPDAFRANYKALADNFKAVVIGTTGWNDIKDEVIGYFESKGTPMIYSSNYSVGVNVISAAVGLVAKYLGQAGGYAPYIVEKHHIHKLDAPSGTAKSLAAVVKENMGVNPDTASVRVGELAGIHTVGFEGLNDRITLTHEAFSRKGFAEGAVLAAQMTEGLSGVHEFKELFFKESAK